MRRGLLCREVDVRRGPSAFPVLSIPRPPCSRNEGADLGAVLSEAQLLAVHDVLDLRQAAAAGAGPTLLPGSDAPMTSVTTGLPVIDRIGVTGLADTSLTSVATGNTGSAPQASPSPSPPSSSAPLVAMSHLRRALKAARSSLPMAERRRLEAIYARFTQGRDPSYPLGNRQQEQADSPHGKKATLA